MPMKFILLFLIVSFVQYGYTQCASRGNSSDGDSWNDSSDDSGSSLSSGMPNLSLSDHANFTFGGGLHTGILSNPIGRNNLLDDRTSFESHELWNQNKLAGYLEVMIPINTKRLIAFGASFSWNNFRLPETHHVTVPSEQAILFSEIPEDLKNLEWSDRSYFNSYTFLAQSDVELARIGSYFRILGRAEFGFTNYRMSTRVNYIDSCGCKQSLLLNENSNFSFTGGLGLGLSLSRGPVEFRTTLGYRFYNQKGLQSMNEIVATDVSFDEMNYDYLGAPTSNLFSLNRPENHTPISQWNGVFYAQFGINIRLGDRWYD